MQKKSEHYLQNMVEITHYSVVTPSAETPKHKIWLSNLDIVASHAYVPILYFYRSTGQPDFFSVESFKAALAKALVVFYPLAGRLTRDSTGRPEINCTGEGVKFYAAQLDATLDDFMNFKPSPEMRKQLVQSIDSADPPCAASVVQITRLRCGSIILCVAHHHYISDGTSFTHFMRTLSAFFRGDNGTIPAPFFDRSLLRARSPPSVSFDHSYYVPNVYQSIEASSTFSHVLIANFNLTKQQIRSFKILAGGEKVSTFCAIMAHIWRCTCIARGLASDIETQLVFPVDLRRRMKPPLPPTYFGNPMLRAMVVAKVEDVVSNTLEYDANLIKNAIDNITDDFGRSLIDHLESSDFKAFSKRGSMSNTSLVANNWLRLPFYDADFGWGKPALVARAQIYGSGHVYLCNSPSLDGGILVIVGLEQDCMECFQKLFYYRSSRI